MRRILFCILSILIIIASCFTAASAQSEDPSTPTLEYWETVWSNIKICTYYTYTGEAPPSEDGENANITSDRKPQKLTSLYESGDYYADLNPLNVSDTAFYKSNYDGYEPYNAAYYIDMPLNLKSGNLTFRFNYSGLNDRNSYTTEDGDIEYFTSFRDMLYSGVTDIQAYAYDSNGNYRLLLEPEFYLWKVYADDDCYYDIMFQFENITDLSYVKIVFKLQTEDTYYDGNSQQSILGRIPYFHTLTLSNDFIYVPPTYEDIVIGGIGEISNQLDSMLFPDSHVQAGVDDLNNKLENTQQNVEDLNAGLQIDKPQDFNTIQDNVDSYFSIMNFEYASNSIGRFWKASVVMRMLMIVGFFSYISFVLFGKKA